MFPPSPGVGGGRFSFAYVVLQSCPKPVSTVNKVACGRQLGAGRKATAQSSCFPNQLCWDHRVMASVKKFR